MHAASGKLDCIPQCIPTTCDVLVTRVETIHVLTRKCDRGYYNRRMCKPNLISLQRIYND
jgi:hypothetical protein